MAKSESLSVQLFGSGSETYPGRMQIQSWTAAEANSRARKKILKIVGTILLCSLIGLIVHLLLLIIIPTLLVTFIGAFPVYLKWSGERITCVEVEGQCPSCKLNTKLRPYLSAQYKNPMTLQCPSCGQTSKAVPVNESDVPALERTVEQSL